MQFFVQKYAEKSVSSTDFTKTFEEYTSKIGKEYMISQLKWDQWIYQPGKFPIEFDFSTTDSKKADDLALAYIDAEGKQSPDNFKVFKDFTEETQLVFLDKLRKSETNLTAEILKKIDSDYHFTESHDPKIKQRWFWMGLIKDYQPVFEKAHQFVSSQGKTENLQFIY